MHRGCCDVCCYRNGTASVPPRVYYYLCSALSFPLCSCLPSGDPFGAARHCLAAARSRRGSDMPPACHSLPRRRFATLRGAALRGKGFKFCADFKTALRTFLAPLLGELAVVRPTEGSPVFSNCQEGKDSTARKNGTVHAVPFTLFNSQIRRRGLGLGRWRRSRRRRDTRSPTRSPPVGRAAPAESPPPARPASPAPAPAPSPCQ